MGQEGREIIVDKDHGYANGKGTPFPAGEVLIAFADNRSKVRRSGFMSRERKAKISLGKEATSHPKAIAMEVAASASNLIGKKVLLW